jgi:hypothetical protein
MSTRSLRHLAQTLLCISLIGAACTSTPTVKPTCTISWDGITNSRLAEYHVAVWRVTPDPTPKATTYIVKAPTTRVSCQEVGANHAGTWQVSIQACIKDGTCSAESNMMLFKVAEK